MNDTLWLVILGFTVAVFSVSAFVDAEGLPPYGFTANMTPTAPGVCACGPSYEFGVRFYSPETGWLTCEDRGGLIGDGNLDVWMAEVEDMRQWGRQELAVVVVR